MVKDGSNPAPSRKPAPGKALDWLSQYYDAEIGKAIDQDYMGWMTAQERRTLFSTSKDMQVMLSINLGEWLLADAQLRVGGKRVRARDLLFGPRGLILDATDKAWLLETMERPMGLFEVGEVRPNKGLFVRDLLDPELRARWVVEKAGSQTLLQWDMVGARLARKDDDWVFTGAMYPMDRDTAAVCLKTLQEELKGLERTSLKARSQTALIIAEYWIGTLIVERPPMQLIDAATKTPLVLVTDTYRVKDWAKIESILSGQADVAGNRDEGWIRFEELGDGQRRSRATLNAKGDRLELFCQSEALANEARAWLDKIANAALTFHIRAIQDPLSPEVCNSAVQRKLPEPEVSQEIQTQITHDYLKEHYANWADEPVPKLGNRTPRKAVQTPEGRRAVIDLLKEYENREARRHRAQGTPLFDFGFLWKAVGLEREP